MRRTWKPLDVGGYRLYEVIEAFAGHDEWNHKYIVVADSPSQAAELVKKQCEGANYKVDPYYYGKALQILQPADWHENGTPCIHEPERWRNGTRAALIKQSESAARGVDVPAPSAPDAALRLGEELIEWASHVCLSQTEKDYTCMFCGKHNINPKNIAHEANCLHVRARELRDALKGER